MEFRLNNQTREIPEAWADEALLHLLRERFDLTGAKFGCGVGTCGACTVIIDGVAERSCITAAREVAGRDVRTIEGLSSGADLHPVQQAWLDLAVPQCGYCQAGQIMTAVALLDEIPSPTEAEIEDALDGNLCRCGTYGRIKSAIIRASEAV